MAASSQRFGCKDSDNNRFLFVFESCHRSRVMLYEGGSFSIGFPRHLTYTARFNFFEKFHFRFISREKLDERGTGRPILSFSFSIPSFFQTLSTIRTALAFSCIIIRTIRVNPFWFFFFSILFKMVYNIIFILVFRPLFR